MGKQARVAPRRSWRLRRFGRCGPGTPEEEYAPGRENLKGKWRPEKRFGWPGGRLFGPASPFSTAPGGLAAQVDGDAGNDRLSFVVNGEPDAATSFAQLDGGPGNDKCHTEGAVNLVINCESSF
jgi:hypothetical protein